MLVSFLRSYFGYSVLYPVKWIRAKLVWAFYYGTFRACNLCGNKLRHFKSYGALKDKNYVCPVCGSFGRQRFLWRTLLKENLLPEREQVILHFAPEWCLERKLRRRVARENYTSGDLSPQCAAKVLDITKLALDDRSFDLIVCSHVLEHVENDSTAMSELHRVLKAGGCLVVQVPIGRQALTYEDSSIVSIDDREKFFGQSDHVRIYGSDILQRLQNAGFVVRVVDARETSTKADFDRYALDIAEHSTQPYSCESRLYLCTKPMT